MDVKTLDKLIAELQIKRVKTLDKPVAKLPIEDDETLDKLMKELPIEDDENLDKLITELQIKDNKTLYKLVRGLYTKGVKTLNRAITELPIEDLKNLDKPITKLPIESDETLDKLITQLPIEGVKTLVKPTAKLPKKGVKALDKLIGKLPIRRADVPLFKRMPNCFEFNKNGKLVYSDKKNFFQGWNPGERERKKLEARIRTIKHVASKRSALRDLEERFKRPKEREILKNILQEFEKKPEPAAKPKQVSSRNAPRELEENRGSPEERESLKSTPQKPEVKSKSSKPAAKFEPQAKFKTTPKPKTAAKSGESAAKAKPATRGEIHEQLYDENGIFIPTQEDLCDCLDRECPGCHFPCSTCSSTKCGNPCRRGRDDMFEEIIFEGSVEKITNEPYRQAIDEYRKGHFFGFLGLERMSV
ncbi:hypothetical protein TKK_0003225 [Trichogramma kaykai]|uniref:ARF7 effector protein C-terminal domain-containing protein n=1 Tax=Trichogramma kaykai TaxID=54128 RepID=A0ABD2WSK6_9HYME